MKVGDTVWIPKFGKNNEPDSITRHKIIGVDVVHQKLKLDDGSWYSRGWLFKKEADAAKFIVNMHISEIKMLREQCDNKCEKLTMRVTALVYSGVVKREDCKGSGIGLSRGSEEAKTRRWKQLFSWAMERRNKGLGSARNEY